MAEPLADLEGRYWATLPTKDLLPQACAQIDTYHEVLTESGILDLIQRTLAKYAWSLVSSRIERAGKKGQYLKLVVNDFASLTRRVHTLLTSNRPAMEPRPLNGDYTSRGAVSLCKGNLEYELTEKHGERKHKRALWRMLLAGEAILFCWFNRMKGKIADVEKPEPGAAQSPRGEPVWEGDIDVRPIHPVDLIRDMTVTSWDEVQWVIVRTRENRHDLVALYPESRDVILKARKEDEKGWRERTVGLVDEAARDRDTDQIEVFHFLHESTPSLPDGRWVVFLDSETSLADDTLAKRNVQKIEDVVQRSAAEECERLPFGFSPLWEELATQDAINIGESTLLTNLANYGIQTVTSPAGAVVQPRMLAEGMRLLELTTPRAEGEVKALNLLNISAAHTGLPDRWLGRMETNIGVNATARGNPPAGVEAGNALALLQTQTIESLHGLEQASNALWEMFGTSLVVHFQRNVNVKRLAAIVGTGSEQHLVALKGSDLEGIQRVKVDTVPYASRTSAQKRSTAEFFLQVPDSGLTVEDYQDVLDNGSLDTRFHKKRDKYLLMQKENEALLKGETVRALAWDPHVDHIRDHVQLANSPDVRRDPKVLKALMAHVLEHQNLLQTLDPVLAAVMEQPSFAQAGANAPPEAGAAPTPGGAAPADPASETLTLPVANAATGEPAQITMPNNPVTGEDWSPAAGGML